MSAFPELALSLWMVMISSSLQLGVAISTPPSTDFPTRFLGSSNSKPFTLRARFNFCHKLSISSCHRTPIQNAAPPESALLTSSFALKTRHRSVHLRRNCNVFKREGKIRGTIGGGDSKGTGRPQHRADGDKHFAVKNGEQPDNEQAKATENDEKEITNALATLRSRFGTKFIDYFLQDYGSRRLISLMSAMIKNVEHVALINTLHGALSDNGTVHIQEYSVWDTLSCGLVPGTGTAAAKTDTMATTASRCPVKAMISVNKLGSDDDRKLERGLRFVEEIYDVKDEEGLSPRTGKYRSSSFREPPPEDPGTGLLPYYW
eukprot:CAMPEP_0184483822 /NCGR_PEP_ID=MMETSP0113_2-20130426/5495_1 /TAXON_ID=91329 /ORGANISM="Norrisiella sphaerica, Strain BC52" /LENGTH=317 /DNA_ID=CAMNT_0026864443 /DNA_START=80 /DNA_END=1030 /DNA_ORIENTATION=-